MEDMEKMCWMIDGSFITDLARVWFWDENKPYEMAEGLLLRHRTGILGYSTCFDGLYQTYVDGSRLTYVDDSRLTYVDGFRPMAEMKVIINILRFDLFSS